MKPNKNDIQNAGSDAFGNPFAGLKIDGLPPAPDQKIPKVQKEPTREEKIAAGLSREDQALLKIFGEKRIPFGGEQGGIPAANEQNIPAPARKGPKLTLVKERKGHGGKTVTKVLGLQENTIDEQMILCSRIKTSLGLGARFVDNVLELQGDQRERAAKFLEDAGYSCKIGN